MSKDIKKKNTKKTPTEKRLVKRPWMRITIVVSIILIILTGIGVGIYFIVESTKTNPYKDIATEMHFTDNISKVQDDILDKDGPEIAIFFYTEGDPISNYMFLDKIDDSEEGLGPLTNFVNSNDDRYWYGIEIKDSENDIAEQLLLNKDQTAFCPEFESLANGVTPNGEQTIYIETASGTGEHADTGIQNSKVTGYSFSVTLYEDDKDNPSDIMFSTDGINKSPFVIQSGTTMWFNSDGSIETIIKSWGETPTSDTSDTSWYSEWLEELSKEQN